MLVVLRGGQNLQFFCSSKICNIGWLFTIQNDRILHGIFKVSQFIDSSEKQGFSIVCKTTVFQSFEKLLFFFWQKKCCEKKKKRNDVDFLAEKIQSLEKMPFLNRLKNKVFQSSKKAWFFNRLKNCSFPIVEKSMVVQS